MANTVKTYRVLRDGMKVGDDVRTFGDFMPEAAGFPNLRSYLGAGFLEEVWVEEEAIEKWKKEREAQRSQAEADEDAETEENESGEVKETPEENSEKVDATEKPKKSVRKRAVVKKTAKSRKTEKDNGRKLAEQNV